MTKIGEIIAVGLFFNVCVAVVWALRRTQPSGIGRKWSVVLIVHTACLGVVMVLFIRALPPEVVLIRDDGLGAQTYECYIAAVSFVFFPMLACLVCNVIGRLGDDLAKLRKRPALPQEE